MTEFVNIPRTIDSAVRSLTDLNGLLTTKEYERAAIVSAFISSGQYTIAAFAKLGIAGLTNKDTVAHYLDAWKQAVTDGVATPVAPGQKVKLPPTEYEFPANPTVARNVSDPERRDRLTRQANLDGVGASKVLDVASNPRAVAAALKSDPKFLKRVMEDPAAVEIVRSAIKEDNAEQFARAREQYEHRASDPTTSARNLLGGRRPYMELQAALHQIRTGTRLLGNLRDDISDEDRAEALSDIDDAARYLSMVADLYRSSNLDSELAAFLATEGENDEQR